MTKLEKLIEELCPNGVGYCSVQELIKNKTIFTVTPSFKIKRNEYKDTGLTPVVSQELEYISGYSDKTDDKIINREYVCFGDHSEHIKYIDFSFVQGADGLKIMYTDTNILLSRYFYYSSLNFYKRHNNYERHFKYFCNTVIPVPPVEVQNEIVRILDNFTELTAELNEKLDAELTARKKQYEYYRELVLDKNENVEWFPLLEIANTFTGLTYKPSEVAPTGTIVLRSSNIQDSKLVFDDNVYVQMDNIPQRAIVQEDDILICVRNGSKALIGKAAIIPHHSEPMAFGAFMTVLRAKKRVSPKYLFFVWQSPRIQNMIHGESGMPINQITKKMLEQIVVPVPPLEIQEKIVEVLDNFDAICSDLNISLPAEIEARKKQYEFYRDLLLTFAEDGKTILTDRQTDRQTEHN